MKIKNKSNRVIWITFVAILMFAIYSCNNGNENNKNGCGNNAIYYWRTIFRMNNYEREFLKKHNIRKMYVKFFDVSKTWDEEEAVPLATTIFIDSIPINLEIVPTIFITSEAIAVYPNFIDKMLTRVFDMAEVNGIKFSEIQIDCDWTEQHAERYFSFMKELKAKLAPKGISLSTTIRLFQLGYEIPAADYGVLMCYNTGNIKEWGTDNSILDINDVKPYIDKLGKYKLPLSIAFPCFSWDVLFTENYKGKYMTGIEFNKFDFSNTEKFKKLSKNKYQVNNKLNYIRHEEPSIEEILDVKKMILKKMSSYTTQIIIYQLDSINLSKFSDKDVEKIYS